MHTKFSISLPVPMRVYMRHSQSTSYFLKDGHLHDLHACKLCPVCNLAILNERKNSKPCHLNTEHQICVGEIELAVRVHVYVGLFTSSRVACSASMLEV